MALKHVGPNEPLNLQPRGDMPAASRTAALVKSDRFEAVRLVIPADTTIPAHKVEGFITLYCVDGRAVLDAGREIELRTGDWIYLERGTPHSLRGIEDSILLLTIFFD